MYSIYNTTFRDTARIYEWVLLKQLWLSFISFLLTSHGENGVCSNFSDVLYSYLLDYIVDNIPENVLAYPFTNFHTGAAVAQWVRTWVGRVGQGKISISILLNANLSFLSFIL